jgi:hypothetical protein
MKQKILIACCLFFSIATHAQLSTNLVLNPRPSARLADWSLNKGTITFIISSQQSAVRRGKIKTTLKAADGTEVSTTDLNLAPTITIPDGTSVLNADVIFPLELQKFTGKYQSNLNKTGKLPADNYQICVQIVEEATFAAITQPKCGFFYLASLQLPICMMPARDQVLDIAKARTAVMFRWTPLVPKPQGATHYRLQVFEVLENQQPMQALRSNQPVLDQIIIEQTQFIWQPRGILGFDNDVPVDSTEQKKGWDGTVKGSGKQFVWSIQSLDALDNPIGVDGNNEGRSEPIVFRIKEIKGPAPHKKMGHVSLMK